MDFVGGRIKGYCGPAQLGAPDDLERVIVDFIARATDTVDVAVQKLDSEPIAEALIQRRLAGCHVRVILNHDYLREEGEAARPSGNRRKIAALAADKSAYKIRVRRGVGVVWTPSVLSVRPLGLTGLRNPSRSLRPRPGCGRRGLGGVGGDSGRRRQR